MKKFYLYPRYSRFLFSRLTLLLSLWGAFLGVPAMAEEPLGHESVLQPERPAADLDKQYLRIGDRLWDEGDQTRAREFYQKAKPAFDDQITEILLEPMADPLLLSPKGRVFWRNASAGIEQDLAKKALISLNLLVEESPHFIPGRIAHIQHLQDNEELDVASEELGNALSGYGSSPELMNFGIEFYKTNEQWLDASLAARQFALLHTESPETEEFLTRADEYWEEYQSDLRAELRGNTFANLITGAIGFVLTGNLLGPLTALESTALLLQGEEAVGDRISQQVQDVAPMVVEEEVNAYIQSIGDRLTPFIGQDRFNYEYYVILNEELNAFALPGGKIFIYAGAILQSRSEAELAGLLGHEISHAALSHGFQLVTEGNLTANLASHIPFGRIAANLLVLDYSRDMERQADALGTQLLASSPYASDGLYNLSVTLNKDERPRPPAWLSTHPDMSERIDNIQTQIVGQNYDRYTFEGISRHEEIQAIVAELMREENRRQRVEENGDIPQESEVTEDSDDVSSDHNHSHHSFHGHHH